MSIQMRTMQDNIDRLDLQLQALRGTVLTLTQHLGHQPVAAPRRMVPRRDPVVNMEPPSDDDL